MKENKLIVEKAEVLVYELTLKITKSISKTLNAQFREGSKIPNCPIPNSPIPICPIPNLK